MEAKTVVNRERERGPNLPKREEPYDPVELELIRADIAFLKEQEEADGDADKWRAAQKEADRTIFSRNHRFIVWTGSANPGASRRSENERYYWGQAWRMAGSSRDWARNRQARRGGKDMSPAQPEGADDVEAVAADLARWPTIYSTTLQK
jgi:hypothetical protein